MASLLNSTANLAKNTVDQGVKGASSVGQAGVDGVGKLGNTIGGQGKDDTTKSESTAAPPTSKSPPTSTVSSGTPADASAPSEASKSGGGLGGFFSTAGSTLTSGASSIINPAVEASKAGGSFLQDVATTGFDVGKKVAQTGADATTNVVVGTADLAGTAIGGVITAAADTSGKVFEPVASGLKAIHGLEGLGESLEKINGLPMQAVKEVGNMTMKALNMSGVTPTFFDTDGDGVVTMADTVKGLKVLGLEDKYANYAAYALHGVFSYPTSDSWVPSTDKTLPIHINKMSNTRWGKNWGTFERVDWCEDVDLDTFFETTTDEDQSSYERWKETFTKGRQYFGMLLLIFEWGTTWPFVFPPNLPVEQIPFKDEIGKVVRKVILPTILANYQRAHGTEHHEGGEGKPPMQRKKSQPPSEKAPTEGKDA